MSQILLIETDDSLRSILKLNMMKNIGCEVIEKVALEEALSILAILPDIDLILCRDQSGTLQIAEEIANYLKAEKSKIPVLIIGEKRTDYQFANAIPATSTWKDVVTMAGKLLGVNVQLEQNLITEDYVAIGINYFLNINSPSMGCDIYIRVKKGDAGFQYIKRLHANDQFSRADIEKYRDAGLKEFFIQKEHFSQFVNYVTNQLIAKLDDASLSAESRATLNSEAYEITLERMNSVGVDEYTIAIVEESLKSMEASIKENNALSSFLSMLRSNKISYAYSHCYLLSILLHKVVEHFEWVTPQIKEKLTVIAYFHDISLADSTLMKIQNMKELEASGLSPADQKLVLNHAMASAEMIENFPKMPAGVGSIIREHHGSKGGYGFSESLSIAIAPLSMMFIVVEDFVDQYLKTEGNPNWQQIEQIVENLKVRYTKMTYAQTVQALSSMILNNK